MDIFRTAVYKKWYRKLKDIRAKALIRMRISRLEDGNPGDCGPIGENCSEMRIHYGPGYRVYFKEICFQDTGKEIVILLCGGDKSTQQADIARAKELAALPIEEEEDGNTESE
ncbi:addiction module antitoxin RelB [Spirochaetia bacterium]|nr:addiction module antitoxin RelB [Spirochaetia bacterium]